MFSSLETAQRLQVRERFHLVLQMRKWSWRRGVYSAMQPFERVSSVTNISSHGQAGAVSFVDEHRNLPKAVK